MKAADLMAVATALAISAFEPISPRMETFDLGSGEGLFKRSRRSRRELPRHEAALRGSGRWSPAMDKPHSPRRVHIRAADGTHHWTARSDWDTPPAPDLQPGTVVEFVNGWGQVVQRTWM